MAFLYLVINGLRCFGVGFREMLKSKSWNLDYVHIFSENILIFTILQSNLQMGNKGIFLSLSKEDSLFLNFCFWKVEHNRYEKQYMHTLASSFPDFPPEHKPLF